MYILGSKVVNYVGNEFDAYDSVNQTTYESYG